MRWAVPVMCLVFACSTTAAEDPGPSVRDLDPTGAWRVIGRGGGRLPSAWSGDSFGLDCDELHCNDELVTIAADAQGPSWDVELTTRWWREDCCPDEEGGYECSLREEESVVTGTLRLLDSNRGFELHIPELGPEAPCVPLDPGGKSLLCGTSEVRLLVRGEGPDLGAWCG